MTTDGMSAWKSPMAANIGSMVRAETRSILHCRPNQPPFQCLGVFRSRYDMTFWKRYARGIIWLTIVIAAIGLGLWLSGCATYQPPGEGIWRAL